MSRPVVALHGGCAAMCGTTTIWRFHDGRTGHDRQSEGLVQALCEHAPCAPHAIDARRIEHAPWLWATRRFPPADHLPDPALIIGAGRRCQWPMLAARRARGGRLIYLMRPGLPAAWFDLCLVPRHDGVAASTHVCLTEGALNTARPSAAHDDTCGVLLVGGPSRHYAWDERGLLEQIAAITAAPPLRGWSICDSRRTPPSTSRALAGLAGNRVAFVPHGATAPDWIARELGRAARAWVSRDSVSMIFEALTAGTAVGLLDVPVRRDSRVTRLAGDLTARGLVVDFAAWRRGCDLPVPAAPLCEARRCAALIARYWLPAVPTDLQCAPDR